MYYDIISESGNLIAEGSLLSRKQVKKIEAEGCQCIKLVKEPNKEDVEGFCGIT